MKFYVLRNIRSGYCSLHELRWNYTVENPFPASKRILAMPRIARASAGGTCSHVLNRATDFHKQRDSDAVLEWMAEATHLASRPTIVYGLWVKWG